MHKKLWNKDFILLLQGNGVSSLGDLMYSVAIGYWVYEQTGSNALMGIMSSISMFVTMFLSPFCGSIVDKCNRKWVIVSIDAIQGILMLTVGVLAYMNALNVPVVLLAALLAAFGSVFYSPAISTLMIDIIPRDEMVRGQSLHSGVVNLINLVGTAFSGAMVAFLGVPLIVVINGASNLYSAFTELLIHVPRTLQQGQKVTAGGVLRDSRRAVGTIFRDPLLQLFVPGALVLNLLSGGPMSLLLPFCLEKGFGVDQYGILGFVFMAGTLIGVLLMGAVKLKPKGRFLALALGFSGSVPFYTAAYLTDGFIPLCVLCFIAAFLNCLGNAVFGASLSLALPQENRSAILGVVHSGSMGGMALSALIYGLLGEVFPLYLIFTVGSIASLPLMLWLCFHPRMKAFVMEHANGEK